MSEKALISEKIKWAVSERNEDNTDAFGRSAFNRYYHVTILRSPTLDPAYLSFYLNSQAGQLQVDMHQRGTSGQLELYPFDIRKFLVWAAPEALQKEIRSLYEQAAASEQRSKKLLSQAKTRVEQLIEEVVLS
jgi:type I restriction enzyme M protein